MFKMVLIFLTTITVIKNYLSVLNASSLLVFLKSK